MKLCFVTSYKFKIILFVNKNKKKDKQNIENKHEEMIRKENQISNCCYAMNNLLFFKFIYQSNILKLVNIFIKLFKKERIDNN